ncbi:MAG: putative response regulator, atypical CheY [Ramlibacter sp.]|nr:putative response regulator, atypical CheY [Ramlibacter sp.]
MNTPLVPSDQDANPASILVIEDDPIQRLAVVGILQRVGYRVLWAVDGEQGLDMARQSVPDLIVCDVVMPGMNGYQLLTTLRQEAGLTGVPVIMLTTMSERAQVRVGMVSGADDYLAKPLNAAELREAVAALLTRRKARHEEIVGDIKDKFLAALEGQKQSLANLYEQRLFKELNARWDDSSRYNEALEYPDSIVLAVDLFSAILARQSPSDDLATAVRQGYQNARDTLYLFGARHLVPQGDDLLAVFVPVPDTDYAAFRVRALRGALALVKNADSGMTVALHTGAATLVHVTDPLHGDAGSVLTGETAPVASALQAFARRSNWRIACSAALLEGLQGQVTTGASASVTAAGTTLQAFELVALT